MFYVMGHFSKFIPVGSIKIKSKTKLNQRDVMVVAFQKPDDGISMVILNK